MISVNNLSKEFIVKKGGKKESIIAVDNVSFEVNQGEMIAFIGSNGAGKSTTIKMLTGVIARSSGEISVLGYEPQKDRVNLVKNIGCLFGQKSSLWMHLPAIDSYRLFGAIYDIEKGKLEERINYLIELFDAKDIVNIPVKKLSLGQRMKAEILASMIHEPKVLFLDEPTIGLDVVSKKKILSIIKELNEKENVTVFLTSHDMSDVERLCSRVIIIDKGRVVLDDKISSLKERYSKTKTITVNYDNIVDENFDDFDVIKYIKEENLLTVRVNKKTDNITKIISSLIKLGEVADIKIDETSLEEIIEDIYKEKKHNE